MPNINPHTGEWFANDAEIAGGQLILKTIPSEAWAELRTVN